MRDIGNGVMMPPMSLHTPRDWQDMLGKEQARRIAELICENEEIQKAINEIKAKAIDEFSERMLKMADLAEDENNAMLSMQCDFASNAASKHAERLREVKP